MLDVLAIWAANIGHPPILASQEQLAALRGVAEFWHLSKADSKAVRLHPYIVIWFMYVESGVCTSLISCCVDPYTLA